MTPAWIAPTTAWSPPPTAAASIWATGATPCRPPSPPANITLAWAGTTGYTTDGVEPGVGPSGAAFDFRVTYRHRTGKTPEYVIVKIFTGAGVEVSGSPFWLTPAADGDYRTGKLYTKLVTLTASDRYSYRFVAKYRPEQGFLPVGGRLNGPRVNNPATLSWNGGTGYTNDGVSPDRGAPGTSFVFRIKYADAEGDAPTWVQLRVLKPDGTALAGSPFAMNQVGTSPDWTAGVLFTKALPLTIAGAYHYRFVANDGYALTCRPASTQMAGPTVDAASPPALTVGALSAQPTGDGVALSYALSAPATVHAQILNLAGRLVADLPAVPQEPGVQTLRWTGRNLAGSPAPAGTYWLRVSARAGDGTQAEAAVSVNLRR